MLLNSVRIVRDSPEDLTLCMFLGALSQPLFPQIATLAHVSLQKGSADVN